MDKVERLDIELYYDDAEMVPRVDGDYVRYSDYLAAREAALEEAAKALEGMKDGCTVDVISGVLLGDKDGPWFLKSECAGAVRALKSPAVPTP